MDYHNEMLKLYFEEKNFSTEKIKRVLEENPYDGYYNNWEQQITNNNRTFVEVIRRNGGLKRSGIVQEIGVHKNNSVAKYLTENVYFTQLSAYDNLTSIKTAPGRLVIFKGIYRSELEFLKRLERTNTPYITGICATEKTFFDRALDTYEMLQSELKDTKLIQEEKKSQKILILRYK